MIKLLSEKTARYLADGDETADVEIIAYGYYMFYQQWIITLAILLVALPFGLFFPVLASVAVAMILRGCAAGTHATHPIICKIAAFAMAFTPVILAEVFALRLTPVVALVIYLLSVALLVKYAPGDTDVKKIRNPKIRRQMKTQSLIWVTVFFTAAVFLNGRFPVIAFVVAAAALMTCSLVHPLIYRLFGFDPVTKEALRPRM